MEHDLDARLREAETQAARLEERLVTVFNNITHIDTEVESIGKNLTDFEEYQRGRNHSILNEIQKVDSKRIGHSIEMGQKLATIQDNQTIMLKQQAELVEMKNKWGGILLAVTVAGGILLTFSTNIMTWVHSLFA